MTENNNVATPELNLTPEIIQAELRLALSKEGLAYQNLLQECEDVIFTRDNLNEDRGALVNLRKMKSKLEAIDNPFTERWKNWNSAKKSLTEPVAELLNRKVNEYKAIAIEIEKENEAAEKEKQRKSGILSEIDNFFINQSQAIAAATEPGELVRIEKIIGSNRAATAKYQEFLPLLTQKAAELTPLIKNQKELLLKLKSLKSAENASELTGNDQDVLDSREAQEEITAKIEQNKIDTQEKSIGMATAAGEEYADVIAPAAPKPRRSTWEFEVTDVAALYKKAPHLVDLVFNSEKIKDILKNKITEGETKGVEEILYLNGLIKFYLHKTY